MSKGEAIELIESGYWAEYLKVTFNEFKQERAQLLVARDLTEQNRIFYAGILAGQYRSIRKIYELADTPTPPSIKAFYTGEWI